MKKKLLSLVMSFMMIFTCVIPISAQSTNRPAESNIVDILEDILGKDDPEIEMKTGTMKIGQTKTVKVDGDLAMHIYQLDVAKETSIQLKANTNAQVFEVAITSDELEPVWEDFVVNEKKDNKELTTDLKLKAGSYAVVVTATKGTSTITSTVKSTALKTISPFTVDAVLPGANVVSGTGLKGATVKVVTSEFKTYTTTVDQNGKYSVKIPTQEEYDSIMVKISKDGYASKLKVVDVEYKEIRTFTVNNIKTTSTTVTGKGLNGATVKAYVNGKQIGKSATVKNGKYSIKIPKQKIGTKVKVKISKTGYESRTKTVTVKKAFTSNLTINSVKKTSTYVTGKGQSGATVRAYVNGKQIGKSATVKNGKYSIKIPKQSKGKKITVKMTKTNYITVSKTTTVK